MSGTISPGWLDQRAPVGPGQILPRAAAQFPDHVALVAGGRSFTYLELDESSDRLAAALVGRGLRPGDVVSLVSQNRWEWIVAYHAALKAGAVVNPVNVMLTSEELRFVLGNCGTVALFGSADRLAAAAGAVEDLPDLRMVVSFDDDGDWSTFSDLVAEGHARDAPQMEPRPQDACSIGYTSGTTGHPKGAVQSHRAVLLNCALTATMHGRSERDVVVTALPAPHVYGNVVINGTFLSGGTVVLMDRFDVDDALDLIAEHRATLFEGVPAMYAAMLASDRVGSTDLSSLTRCTVGGQIIPVPVIERWQRVSGAPLLELWGMTEIAGLGTTHSVHAPPLPGSIGVALPGVEVRIRDLTDSMRTVPVGEPGELMIRGPIVMIGYHDDPEATAETIDADGWLHTGDLGQMTEDGHVFIVDRLKDMVITAGYNVYPAEIERVLAEHPAVAMVAVGSVPDPVKGELACAYVVLRAGSSASEVELIDFTSDRLAAYKRPRQVRFVANLPKTSSGKIMRRELIKSY